MPFTNLSTKTKIHLEFSREKKNILLAHTPRKKKKKAGWIKRSKKKIIHIPDPPSPLKLNGWPLTIASFSTNDESEYEPKIWKKVLKTMRKVSNLVRRTRRTTSLKS